MEYIKVKWIHDNKQEPVWLYSELDNSRNEIRKVEIYANGDYGFASEDLSTEDTQLSETCLPLNDEINSSKEFELKIIDKKEFEDAFSKAVIHKND